MDILFQVLFAVILGAAVFLFARNVKKVRRNILLGKDVKMVGNPAERFRIMMLVAFGQQKMFKRPWPALLHLIVYAGFVIINIEILEILIDGLVGTHRVFASFLPTGFYNFVIAFFELLAFGVLVACLIFLVRRNITRVPRLNMYELTKWPRTDANIILITEVVLMTLFLSMNATDLILQQRGHDHYVQAGAFPISRFIAPMFFNLSDNGLVGIERTAWWLHILGVLAFLNYLVISKHFHILLAFPNTYYSRLTPKAYLDSPEYVTNEVKAMLDPSAVVGEPYTGKFGAKDVPDLSWKQLLDAYTCTECGRCTDECPANKTGKKLSPRKIMMDTRDRMEEIGRGLDKHGSSFTDNKTLLHDYITDEELWACTTCQACVEACPVNIDPLSIIVDLRRNLVMEESKMPAELASMSTNIENNQAPWQFSPSTRFDWADGMEIPTMADVVGRGEEVEVLFWVGCAGSFDDRYKSVTRSFANILKAANIKFAVLGTEESCTGDPAKRAGNEFLAQMQGMNNVTVLNGYGVKRIVTACPHCFNQLQNEYPALGGQYEVIHHSVLLAKLIAEGKVVINENALVGTSVTYHDSCYMGRGNGVYEAPREVINALKVEMREMKRSKQNGLCCGGGGAQVFKEEEPGKIRVNTERAREAVATESKIIAAACPFCMIMLEDGVKQNNADENVKVKDLAELVAEANGYNKNATS